MIFLNNTTTKNCQVVTINHIQKKHATLQMSDLAYRAVDCNFISSTQSIYYPERSFLYASPVLKGSITLEAAISLPIFIIFFIALIFIMNIMYVQLTLQIQLEETARHISRTAYASTAFYSLTDQDKEELVTKDYSFIENLGATVISIGSIQQHFLDNDMREFLDNSPIVNGSKGVNFLSTSVDLDNGIIDMILTYTVNIPFIPADVISFDLSNRCCIRLYMGKDLEVEQTEETVYLYYTSYGKVYHINKYCRYLLNYSNVSRFKEIDLSIYQQCGLCVSETLNILEKRNPMVYTSNSGYAFHTSLECSSFTGNIFRTTYDSSISDEAICSECLRGK